MKLLLALAFLPMGPALVTEASADSLLMSKLEKAKVEAQAMEGAFRRSEEAHKASMESMLQRMTVETAANMLEKSKKATKELGEVTRMVRQGRSNLRYSPPKGYAGLEGAKKLLNDMIYDTFKEYDHTIWRCGDWYGWLCDSMAYCRGTISASNFVAANARKFILASQSIINRCQEDIPTKSNELNTTRHNTNNQLKTMEAREKVVKADLDVLTAILKMTDCKANKKASGTFTQIRKCTDRCTGQSYIEFDNEELKKTVAKLKSKKILKTMHETFDDLFQGVEEIQSLEFIQTGAKQMPINKTNFTNPPVPRTDVPADPCSDKGPPVPTLATKEAASCEIGDSPQCYKIQEKFLLIQSGVKDEYDELVDAIAALKAWLEQEIKTLMAQIEEDKTSLESANTELSDAMTKEATAGEIARHTASHHDELDDQLRTHMKKCNAEYIRLEGEVCALKKIRGELFKIKGGSNDASYFFFQDCELTPWLEHECMGFRSGDLQPVTCGGGFQFLTRTVLTHEDGGAKCLPQRWHQWCNENPCPRDCELAQWTKWSKCSAECGGGTTQRLRKVKKAERHGGTPCGATEENDACNTESCEEDCELKEWTGWSKCSKHCDGGTQKRTRSIKEGVKGEGNCPKKWSLERLEYQKCNTGPCELPDPTKALPCESSMDVVLLLDGSGSLGKAGFESERKAADLLVDAFADGAAKGGGSEEEAKTRIALILFSGPKTWSGVSKCTGDGEIVEKVNMKTDCSINVVEHFTNNLKQVKEDISKLPWPQGSTLTSLALMAAKAELQLGRKTATSAVVIITDGRPLSVRQTGNAAHELRKQTRLVWVPVTANIPLKDIKDWATRRWEENVVVVLNFEDLAKPDPMSKVIADICPEPFGYDHWR